MHEAAPDGDLVCRNGHERRGLGERGHLENRLTGNRSPVISEVESPGWFSDRIETHRHSRVMIANSGSKRHLIRIYFCNYMHTIEIKMVSSVFPRYLQSIFSNRNRPYDHGRSKYNSTKRKIVLYQTKHVQF